jgi:hypothetical protein
VLLVDDDRLHNLGGQHAPVECSQDRVRIACQRVHERFARLHVVQSHDGLPGAM